MKKKKIIIPIIGILVVILLLVGLYFYGLTSVSKTSEPVTFTVESGMGTRQIISKLYEERLIKSNIATNIYLLFHKDLVFKAGVYNLDRSSDTKTIINSITKGDAVKDTLTITFIEGKKLKDYVKQISNQFGYSEDEIMNTLEDENFLKELINKYDFLSDDILNKDIYYPLEGYLFPDTYEFYKNASIKDIIEKMVANCGKILDNYSASLKESSYSVHEILTMASIIENETRKPEDRPEASQVIHKRLSINMSLGMDVTAYYGVKKDLNESLTVGEFNDVNPYNTRRTDFIGLPVGPICNPGKASIEAALKPSSTNHLYFYALKDGSLKFADTYEEFLEIKRNNS